MSVLSKYFEDAISIATCRDIVHPHTDSCLQAAYGYFFKPVWTTVQFFVPLFMVNVLNICRFFLHKMKIDFRSHSLKSKNYSQRSQPVQEKKNWIDLHLRRCLKIWSEPFLLHYLPDQLEHYACVDFSKQQLKSIRLNRRQTKFRWWTLSDTILCWDIQYFARYSIFLSLHHYFGL